MGAPFLPRFFCGGSGDLESGGSPGKALKIKRTEYKCHSSHALSLCLRLFLRVILMRLIVPRILLVDLV
jgi:hypothetical protein